MAGSGRLPGILLRMLRICNTAYQVDRVSRLLTFSNVYLSVIRIRRQYYILGSVYPELRLRMDPDPLFEMTDSDLGGQLDRPDPAYCYLYIFFSQEASYEPELHPGVTYKLKQPKATLKVP
jgi:hypothetical protein